jgi:gliding motility-associated-like protein
VTDQNGCQVNTSQQVTVNQNVTNLFPTDTISACGSSYVLDAGAGYANYQWNTGAQTQTINATNSGWYYCTVSNGACISTDSLYVILYHVDAGNDTTICNGNSVQLNGSGGLIYNWTPTNGLNNPNIANPIATPQTTTTYHLTSQVTMRNLIANSDFESGYNSFSSSYNPSPTNQFEGEYVITNSPNAWNPGFNNCGDHTSGSGNMLLINGSTTPNVTVYCQTVNVTPNTNYAFTTWLSSMNSVNPALLQFSINGINLGNTFNASSNSCDWNQFYSTWNSGTNNTASICIVNQNSLALGNDFALDDIGFFELCNSIDSVTVTVNNLSINLFAQDTIRACNASYVLDAGAGYANYQWNTGAQTQTINATNSGWYYCSVTQGNCISNDSVFLSLVNSSINSVTQTVCDSLRWYGTLYVNSGTYTYTYTNANGCASTDTLHLTVNRSTHFSFTQTICDSLRWNGMLYQLSGIYLYNYNNSAGCASTDTLHLTIKSSTHQSESHEACRYFIWHETVYRSSGIYFYRYINNANCPSVDTLHLTIHPGPNLGPDKRNKICYGTDFNLNSLYNLTAINIINWTLNNNSVSDPIHANQAGNYQLIVGDIFGCTDTAMVNLSINPPIICNAGNDTIVQMNTPFQLHGSGGQTYIWSPAGVLNNPFIAAPWGNISGTTEFMLTTFDDIGCSDEDSVNVRAIEGPQFYVPNAFTPNGDGLNDIFRPINVGIPTITEFCIYSRYGEKIFETSNLKKGWDGNYKGLKQPMSNYVWIVKGIDINNKSVQKKGNVLLIR